MVAFTVVLIAAVIEAISARHVLPGMATVAARCVASGLLLLATPGILDSVELDTMSAMGVVLVAIAVREVWARHRKRRQRRLGRLTPIEFETINQTATAA